MSVVHLDVPLADLGLRCVEGRNGSGKSTVFQHAIPWCFWGQTVTGLRGDEVVSGRTGENCWVKVAVTGKDRSFALMRGQSMTREGWKQALGKPRSKANDLVLWIDGEERTQGTMAATEELAEALLGMGFETWAQSILLSGAEVPFAALAPADQGRVIEQVLGIGPIMAARKLAAERLAGIRAEKTGMDLQAGEIRRACEAARMRAEELRAKEAVHAEESARKAADERATAERRLAEMREREKAFDEKVRDDLRLAQERVQAAKEAIEAPACDFASLLGAACVVEDDAMGSLRQAQQEVLRLTQRVAGKRGEMQASLAVAIREAQEKRKEADQIASIQGGRCPVCRQEVTVESSSGCIEEALGQAADKEAEAARQREALAVLGQVEGEMLGTARASEAEAQKRLRDAQEEVGRVRLASADAEAKLKAARREMDAASAELSRLQQASNPYSKLAREAELASRVEFDPAQNPYSDLAEKAEEEVGRLRSEAGEKESAALEKEEAASYLAWWEDGFRRLRVRLLQQAVPFLNDRAKKYAAIVSGEGIDLSVRFRTGRELADGRWKDEFGVDVENIGNARGYKGNSKGERGRANAVIAWALADLAASRGAGSVRYRCLDEPFDGLDEPGEEAVMRLLQAAAAEHGSVLAMTHNPRMAAQFGKHVRVVKTREGGTILG